MRQIPFVPKRPAGEQPWITFGSDQADYDKWSGEVCAIACARSLILAKEGQSSSLWDLTKEAVEAGVFIVHPDRVDGAFHFPLAAWLQRYRLKAQPFRLASETTIWEMMRDSMVLLSIDLSKVGAQGSHLILLIDRDPDNNAYLLHDSASLLGRPGDNCRVSRVEIERLSNRKGIRVADFT
jgi:hypothetical protein